MIDYNIYKPDRNEWMMILLSSSMISALISFLFYKNVLAFLIIFPLFSYFYLKYKKKRYLLKRKWLLTIQFSDGIKAVSSALQAGYSIENAISEAINDLSILYQPKDYILLELKGIERQVKNSKRVEEAMREFGERSHIEDIIDFADVLMIAKKSGGNLVRIIKKSSQQLNEKIEVKRELKTMIAGKQYEADIMSMVPLFILFYLSAFSKDFMVPLYNNVMGVMIMTVVLVIYLAAFYWMKRIVQIEI